MLTRRPITAEDEWFLRVLNDELVTEELGAAAWPEQVRTSILDIQYRARRQGFRSSAGRVLEDLVVLDGEPVGWMITARDEEAVLLVDIAILREFRGRGLGGELIRGLQGDARGAGLAVKLSVVRQNPALRLYERLGFVVAGGDELRWFMEWRG